MLFICDRNGPVPANEIGLPHNPESEHRRDVVSRAVQIWNRVNLDRPLKVVSANDRFPIERWDPDLFELLTVVPAEPVENSGGGGGGISNPVQGDLTVNGDLIVSGSVRNTATTNPVAGYLSDGTPFYRWRGVLDVVGTRANVTLLLFHGVPGGVATNNRIIQAHAGLTNNLVDPNLVTFGGEDAVQYTISRITVIDDRVEPFIAVVGNPFLDLKIYAYFDYI